MRVAVVGSGISGHGAALSLQGMPGISVTVFEQQERPGGHANTLDLDIASQPLAVDTGFIVYNDENYPNFRQLLRWLAVETQPSDMSFALSLGNGAYEWAGSQTNTISGLFAQRSNAVSPAHWKMLVEILRFQRLARKQVAEGLAPQGTLAHYLDENGFSANLRERYVLPMGAAIWSMTRGQMLDFPAASFLTFFDNHKLLHFHRPQWRTVTGGSRNYVARLAQMFGSNLRLNAQITRIVRSANGVTLFDKAGGSHDFDHVVVATSATNALAMLADVRPHERDILGSFRVSENHAVVHTDERLMPKSKTAWASWNVIADAQGNMAAITYWMNRLQNLQTSTNVFVTLNPSVAPRPQLVLANVGYTHPIYDAAAIAAQHRLQSIQGPLVYFAGAWTGYGFHEDGLRSGLAAAEHLGGRAPWERP